MYSLSGYRNNVWKYDKSCRGYFLHFEQKCCEAISRLTLARIEVLYLDGSHAWIKNNQ